MLIILLLAALGYALPAANLSHVTSSNVSYASHPTNSSTSILNFGSFREFRNARCTRIPPDNPAEARIRVRWEMTGAYNCPDAINRSYYTTLFIYKFQCYQIDGNHWALDASTIHGCEALGDLTSLLYLFGCSQNSQAEIPWE